MYGQALFKVQVRYSLICYSPFAIRYSLFAMHIGLDFGTTNSGAAVFDGQRVHVFPLDPASQDPTVVRSTLYVTRDHQVFVGKEAVDAYYRQNIGRPSKMVRQYIGEIEMTFAEIGTFVRDVYVLVDELTPGRLLRSLKSGLATSYEGTTIFGRYYELEELLALYLGEIRRRVEKETGQAVEGVVLGRPVNFAGSGGEADNQRAEDRLRRAAERAGFRHVSFELEPVAAALHYELTVKEPQNVVVFDFGGGTLDITVMRVGDLHVGTTFYGRPEAGGHGDPPRQDDTRGRPETDGHGDPPRQDDTRGRPETDGYGDPSRQDDTRGRPEAGGHGDPPRQDDTRGRPETDGHGDPSRPVGATLRGRPEAGGHGDPPRQNQTLRGRPDRQIFATGGVGIAGDVFDQRIVQDLLLEHFGRGTTVQMDLASPSIKRQTSRVTRHASRIMPHPPIPFPDQYTDALVNWQTVPELNRPETLHFLQLAQLGGNHPARVRALESLLVNNYAIRLFDKVEQAKIALSEAHFEVIHLSGEDIHVWQPLTRSQFESLIAQETQRIEACLLDTLARSGLQISEIDAVVRTGGSAQIPCFIHMLERIFGPQKVVLSDVFSGVTSGLAIRAYR
jgi:RNase H-fold protein (predicted Holliday junction resolvase)